jgi:hypothetical protein
VGEACCKILFVTGLVLLLISGIGCLAKSCLPENAEIERTSPLFGESLEHPMWIFSQASSHPTQSCQKCAVASDDGEEGKENIPASRRISAAVMPLTLPTTPSDKPSFAFG